MSNPSIDIGRYLRAPRAATLTCLALARLSVRHAPEDLDEHGKRALSGLADEAAGVTDELVARHIDHSGEERSEEAAIDHADDGLWYVVRDRLEHWRVFARPGFALLARRQEPGGFDYAGAITASERAAYVHRRVLGPGGVDFTRGSYTDQLERMITVWKVIEGEGYGEELRAMVGPVFYDGLVDCHARYVEMVERRAARDGRPRPSLVELRRRLGEALVKYNAALIAALDQDDPESVSRFRAAVAPFDMFLAQIERGRRSRSAPDGDESGGEAGDEGDEGADGEFDELTAEEQSVEAELGLAPVDDLE